jgi:hypothetical protein
MRTVKSYRRKGIGEKSIIEFQFQFRMKGKVVEDVAERHAGCDTSYLFLESD